MPFPDSASSVSLLPQARARAAEEAQRVKEGLAQPSWKLEMEAEMEAVKPRARKPRQMGKSKPKVGPGEHAPKRRAKVLASERGPEPLQASSTAPIPPALDTV